MARFFSKSPLVAIVGSPSGRLGGRPRMVYMLDMMKVSELLAAPEVGLGARARGTLRLRYEDVAQDGTLKPHVLSAGLGASVWEALVRDEATRHMRESGELPILTRLVLAAGAGPISVATPLEIDGVYRFAHGRGADGEVERIYVEMWADARAPEGHTFGPRPAPDAPRIVCGRLYAEHVITRPFAPKGQRKVVRLSHPGADAVPGPAIPIVPPRATFVVPEGAVAHDEERRPVVFSLAHTDSNQHVSSLAYLAFAEDMAALVLGARAGGPLSIASAELAYGKPSFAGERLTLVARPFERVEEGRAVLGATFAFVDEGKATEEGRTFVRLVFR